MNAINNLAYYADLASEDYYIKGGEPAGIWAGRGSLDLGLHGQIKMDAYHNVFRGFSPDGKPLCENAGDSHRPGWDLTFSAPKSLSILWARLDKDTQQQIQSAQLSAVREALTFLENHAAMTRRGHGGKTLEPVAGLIAAIFEHSTSRAQDMALHSHCLVANIAPRNDGSWGTIESRQLFLWQKAAGAIYRSNLANELRQIGFEVEQYEEKSCFEVKGVPQSICRYFSKRAEAINSALSTINARSSASTIGDAIKLSTRAYKKHVDRTSLFRQWHIELNEFGFTHEKAKALQLDSSLAIPTPLPLSELIERAVEKQAVFRLQDLYELVAIEAQWQHTSQSEIEFTIKNFVEQGNVTFLGMDHLNNQLFSTPAMIEQEQKLIHISDLLQKKTQYLLTESTIQNAINKQSSQQGYSLSEEQTESVFAVCQSSLDILQGAAGAGKSTSMRAVRIAYEETGFNVLGATVSRQAADQLERETGIKSHTIAKLLIELERNKTFLNNTVLLIDEAGQIPSKDLLQLTEAINHANGKLILVGEQQQLDAITHSGSLRYLSQRQGYARIQTIRRQRKSWARKAVMDFRNGNAYTAINAHHQQGLLHFSDSSHKSREKLIQEWQKHRLQNTNKNTMVLAQRWTDVQSLNSLVRKIYQAENIVGNENIETDCAVSNQVMRCSFSRGERVRFCRNDYRRQFTNGQLGTIKDVELKGDDIKFTVLCDDGRLANFKQSDYCDDKGNLYLVQAYASTVYSSQGSTIDGDVFVYYTSNMDRSSTYVAGSRHKDNCHWFINREEIDALSGARDSGVKPSDGQRMKTLGHCMSINKKKSLAIEWLAEKETLDISNQNETINEDSLFPHMELEAS